MDYTIYQVDAFTDTLFKGNPACVVPLEKWLDDSILLNIAKENAVPETAFFVKNDKSKLDFILSNNGFIYIDDLKYNYENKKPKIKTKLLKKIKLTNLIFFRFNNNWVELKKKILKL